jgi:SAM-dependent methyltransferase
MDGRFAALAVTGLALAVACGPSSPAVNDDHPREPRPAVAERHEAATPHGEGTYEGRPIAPTCSYLGADWLDRPDRAEREQPDRVLDALHLDRSAAVADVGAGTGYFTVRLARRVAKVHATEVQPEMIHLLAERIAHERLTNVELHLATPHDAALPPSCCALILLVDVYHELADPAAVMAGIRRALTERGRLVLIEYRGEDPDVPIRPEHKMTLPQIQRELSRLGFAFVESLEFLPDQRIVVFTAALR